jgi:SnoaL-like domain
MLERLHVAASLCVAAAVVAVPTRAAPTIDDGATAATVGRSWIAAVNRGDLAGAVARVAPSAVFDIGGARYRGRAAIRRWISGDPLASDGRYTVLRVEKDNATRSSRSTSAPAQCARRFAIASSPSGAVS